MPLGAEDVEPAERDDFLALDGALAFVLFDELQELFRLGVGKAAVLEEFDLRHHLGVAAQDDVGAAAGHVGRHGDGALASGLRDDLRFFRVVLRVQDVMRDAFFLEDLGDGRRLFDAGRADEHGLPALVKLGQLFDDRGEFLALGLVDDVLVVAADDGLVRRDDDDVELVRAVELGGLGVGGAVWKVIVAIVRLSS